MGAPAAVGQRNTRPCTPARSAGPRTMLARHAAAAARGGARALSAAAPAPIDLYKILGVARDASPEQIKAGFRAAAKRLHPDTGAGGGDLEAFKRVSEAHTVLSDECAAARGAPAVSPHLLSGRARARSLPASLPLPASRAAYDAAHYGGGAREAPAPTAESLRERNEGVFGGVAPVDARRAARDGGENAADAYRAAMYRAAEKVRDGARFRASLARANRARVEMPAVGGFSAAALLPVFALGIWAVNYALFMR